jgi:hypothetical protein
MNLVALLILVVVAGLCLFLVETFIPMPSPIRRVLRIIVVLYLVLYLLDSFGLAHIKLL